jgi:hypothetical protein
MYQVMKPKPKFCKGFGVAVEPRYKSSPSEEPASVSNWWWVIDAKLDGVTSKRDL